MAQYEHLKVYKKSYELMIESYKLIKNYPREYKYTLWEKIKEMTLDLIMLIYEANSSTDLLKKREIIYTAIWEWEKIKMLLRVSKDVNILSLKKYTNVIVIVVEVLSQLEWWKKYNDRLNHKA